MIVEIDATGKRIHSQQPTLPIWLHYPRTHSKKYSLKKFIESVRLQLDNNMVNSMSIHSFLPGS